MDETITFTISELWRWLLTACAGIVTISAAAMVIVNIGKLVKKPNVEQCTRITTLEKIVDKHESYFESDNKRIESMEEGNRVTQTAILALLDNGIDGNNITQMRAAKELLQKHLIQK